MSRLSVRNRRALLDEAACQRIYAVVSLLLGYPDERLIADLPVVAGALPELAPPASAPLSRFVAHLRTTPQPQLAAHYVEIFDLRRRCCLYLTYYAFGDTRRRGLALLRFTEAYRASGLEPPTEELPDHLAVVCGFAARDPRPGTELLLAHRAGIELLRLALDEAGSPYLDVLEALSVALPGPTPGDPEEALALAREGPPAEEVGLEPFLAAERLEGPRR